MTVILGINGVEGIFHDASASIIMDNKIITCVEEERFNRIKHSNGIPFNAIDFCLKKANVSFEEVEHIGYYLDPYILKKVFVDDIVSKFPCQVEKLQYLIDAADRASRVETTIKEKYGSMLPKFHYVNHHLAHASSAYYISGFDESAILTLDGSGERETCVIYYAKGNQITKIQDILVYPESLGFIYTIIANHLGLGWIEGPGKLMGLAGYGTPLPELFNDIIILNSDIKCPIKIDLSFFNYHIGGTGLTAKGLERFGQPRQAGEELSKKHYDLAASIQQMLEKAVMHVVSFIPKVIPQTRNLCFSGGIALNVRANRVILDSGLFDNFFIPPHVYDAGTSLGCALYLNAKYNGNHNYKFNVYCGPNIEDFDISYALTKFKDSLRWEKLDEHSLCVKAAQYIKDNKIIGWSQGGMEYGPRALGNRSILTNPMNANAKDELNSKVKHRESFRPYAPSVLQEESRKWFDLTKPSPFMLIEAYVLPEKRSIVPGITHVDGTSRIQTVTKEDNPMYYNLIECFFQVTGVPLVLNTSFNRHGEPVVNKPDEAISILMETGMDALFIGNYHIIKKQSIGEKNAK